MASELLRSASSRSQRWLRKKSKKSEPSSSLEVSDGEPEEYLSNSFVSSRGIQSSGLSHELRIFIGTWNVAGKSPVGSLAADLEEWLNPNSSVDIYVLGFQEIVPLNTMSVIGIEDYTDARRWNLMIGKTLNKEDGCVWLTPTVTPVTDEDYQYAKPVSSRRQTGLRRSITPQRERTKAHTSVIDDDYQYAKPVSSRRQTGFRRSITPQRERLKDQPPEEGRSASTYRLMASKKMVGVFITIWMKRELLKKYRVSNVKACPIACGYLGYLGNKGAISVSMSIDGTSFCFITAHLASGEKKGDEGRRNQQVVEIFKRTSFPRAPQEINEFHPVTIKGHDRIFWFGDLNYRLCMEDEMARELIRKKKWKKLQKFDQLKKEQHQGGVFQGWKEGDIEFAPTYKYSVELDNSYTGDKNAPSAPNTGEKRRTPAWCDRILWHGKGIEQLSYYRGESKFSDHRPVSALFTAEIDVLKPANSKTVALSKFLSSMNIYKFSDQIKCREERTQKSGEEPKRTLLSLMRAEVDEESVERAVTTGNMS